MNASRPTGGDSRDATAALNDACKYGEVTGALNAAVGGDVKMDVHDGKISETTDTRFYGYHVGGGVIPDIPVVGVFAPEVAEDAVGEAQQRYISGRQTAYEALRSR